MSAMKIVIIRAILLAIAACACRSSHQATEQTVRLVPRSGTSIELVNLASADIICNPVVRYHGDTAMIDFERKWFGSVEDSVAVNTSANYIKCEGLIYRVDYNGPTQIMRIVPMTTP